MNDKVLEARRALFESWDMDSFGSVKEEHEIDCHGDYIDPSVSQCWQSFNAALDLVEIRLPEFIGLDQQFTGMPISEIRAQNHYNKAVLDCRAAIESTNLGLRVK